MGSFGISSFLQLTYAPPATVERANSRRSYDIIPVKLQNLAEQQRIADTYYAAKLIPKPLNVSDITVWTPKP
ncbi:hypothetical protein [Pseudomonas fluorescens]|uniref:hypothetical protein n=1 Tax=Pseudomonas fluorescens TaxID=294 RepID=UPI002023AD11|nr:hypothetical protein [Pseudomonas fluorescens]